MNFIEKHVLIKKIFKNGFAIMGLSHNLLISLKKVQL